MKGIHPLSRNSRPRFGPVVVVFATVFLLVSVSGAAVAQSSLGAPDLGGMWGKALGNMPNPPPSEPAPPIEEPQTPSTSRSYYPDAGSGSVRDQLNRSRGAYGAIFGDEQPLNCGAGCTAQSGYCTCPPEVIGQPRTPPNNAASPYRGGSATPDDVVGSPAHDGNVGLPEGD